MDLFAAGLFAAALLLSAAAPVLAQPGPGAQPGSGLDFGVELEFRGREVTPRTVAERSFSDYVRVLEPIVRELGGDPSRIKRVDFTKGERQLMRAEWTDPRGRTWKVEPEWVTGGGRQQVDFEVVTPRMQDPAELQRVVGALRQSGVVREGLQSGMHIHVDAKGLIGPRGDATALINLIQLHETLEPQLRRLFAPSRGAGIYNPANPSAGPEGAWVNRFSRPIYLDHPELLQELSRLPAGERTQAKLEELFRARNASEARLHGSNTGDLAGKGWKYRSLNLANLLEINPNHPRTKTTVEFRMNDLSLDPSTHPLQVELYRALVARAKALAAQGKVVPAPTRAALPAGQDPARFYTSEDPVRAKEQLRGMLRELGLDPQRFEPLLERNVRGPPVRNAEDFSRRLAEVRLDEATRISAGERGGRGDSGLSAALESLRTQGERPDLLVRIPVAANEVALALETARSLAQRANAALHLQAVAHAGPQASTPLREVVRAEAGANEVLLRIAPEGISLARLTQLTRLLSEGVRQGVVLRGSASGLPSGPGSLVAAARLHADQVEGRQLTARQQRALEVIAQRGGGQLLLPLLNWGAEPYLEAARARDLRFRQERYLSQLIELAESISPRTGGIDPAVTKARELVRGWANQTGLGELLFRSLLPNRIGAPTLNERLARYRRADGTLRWKRALADRALTEVGGLAHFGLALFLKEVAVVAATGDQARIEEFFDGLMTTDFYKHYGLFVAGARVGEVAYVRYLQRYVKPRFVNGLLKTNLVLAAGLALPMIVEGNFEGRAFAISLGSLGISSAAVKGGVSSIRWVMSLSRARKTGVLARLGLQGSRLARFGGWFYTAAELAVVLYFAEEIDQRVNAWLDQRAARAELAAANERYLAKINDPDASAEVLAAAGDEVHQAWIAYRDFLYGPLHVDEITLASRLEKVARAAKLQADERAATLDRLRRHPNLARSITNRYGSLEAYADARQREDEAKIQEQVETYLSSYERSRAANLEAVYRSNRREGDFLDDLGHPEWLLAGGVEGSASDPWGQRSDPFASWGRDSARKALTSALGGASKNRLQAYEDERALYERLLSVARAAGRERAVSALERQRDRVDVLSAADRRLIESGGAVEVEGAVRRGAADRVRGR